MQYNYESKEEVQAFCDLLPRQLICLDRRGSYQLPRPQKTQPHFLKSILQGYQFFLDEETVEAY